MIGSTPTTSPSSGAASASIASLSPQAQDLSDEFEAVDTTSELSPRSTLQSKPSVLSKNAFAAAASTNNAARGNNNNNTVQRPVNRNLLESMMGLRGTVNNETKFSFYRMMVGSMFAYVVLGIWIWTVVHFMVIIQKQKCGSSYTDLGSTQNVLPGSGLDFGNPTATMSCLDVFTGSLACAHSITFGLISAVVIHETGSHESAKDRLSSMINPLLKRQDINANCVQRTFCSLITSLPAVYVIAWTVFGLICFVYSLVLPDGRTGPLFYTGQTWIGLVVKATYSFFNVQETDDSNVATSQPHLSQHRGQDEV